MSEPKSQDKPFQISKWKVWEAYERVKANKGAAGVDEQSITEFEADRDRNLYQIWNRMSSGSYFPPPVKAVEIPKAGGKGVRCSEFRRSPHTARSSRPAEVSESFVTVTHPFHPLAGQRLRVLFERKLAGGLAVSCEGGPLGSLMLPLAWTDRGPAAADAPLTYEVLAELAGAISAVQSRHGR